MPASQQPGIKEGGLLVLGYWGKTSEDRAVTTVENVDRTLQCPEGVFRKEAYYSQPRLSGSFLVPCKEVSPPYLPSSC